MALSKGEVIEMEKDWWFDKDGDCSDSPDKSGVIFDGIIFEWGTLAKGERPSHSAYDDRISMWYPDAYREICRRYWGTPGRLGLAHFIKTANRETVVDYAKEMYGLCVGDRGVMVGFRVTAEGNLSNGYPVYLLEWSVG